MGVCANRLSGKATGLVALWDREHHNEHAPYTMQQGVKATAGTDGDSLARAVPFARSMSRIQM